MSNFFTGCDFHAHQIVETGINRINELLGPLQTASVEVLRQKLHFPTVSALKGVTKCAKKGNPAGIPHFLQPSPTSNAHKQTKDEIGSKGGKKSSALPLERGCSGKTTAEPGAAPGKLNKIPK